MPASAGTERLVALFLLLAVAGCAGRPEVPPPAGAGSAVPPAPPADPLPRKEPRSRYGNGPVYEVFGREYRVLPNSYGYRERGVASWYGRKFHGRPTSSREPYDMHAMTAAHKSLPLPTWVEVRNLKNDRRVVVRVNDRGPFVKNRLIDLSYAAASKLGIVRDGTGLVEVTAISFDDPPQPAPVPEPTAATEPAVTPEPAAAPDTARDRGTPAPRTAPGADEPRLYLQVGAFGEAGNAERRQRVLAAHGIRPAFIQKQAGRSPAIYRVRIGPLSGVEHYDRIVDQLSRIGIADSHLVTE